jgi:hypothetical protein
MPSAQLKEKDWALKEKEDIVKEQDTKLEQLRDMNELLRSQLRGDLKGALQSFGNGRDRQAKSDARYKMATMEKEGMEEEEDQDPVYTRIAEHFARDGKGNFKLHVRELASPTRKCNADLHLKPDILTPSDFVELGAITC